MTNEGKTSSSCSDVPSSSCNGGTGLKKKISMDRSNAKADSSHPSTKELVPNTLPKPLLSSNPFTDEVAVIPSTSGAAVVSCSLQNVETAAEPPPIPATGNPTMTLMATPKKICKNGSVDVSVSVGSNATREGMEGKTVVVGNETYFLPRPPSVVVVEPTRLPVKPIAVTKTALFLPLPPAGAHIGMCIYFYPFITYLMKNMAFRLINWLIDWLIDRLIDWLFEWLIDWLVGWLIFPFIERVSG